MFKRRSILNNLILFPAILGFVFVIGCGTSEKMHKMSDFLIEYSKAVDEYSDAIDKGDKEKIAELDKKIKSFMSRWTEMEMGMELTPQEVNKLDKEYHNITEKYHNLAQKS